MKTITKEEYLICQNDDLKQQLEGYRELVDAIKNGEVDALAINKDGKHDVFTLQSNDFVYRVLVENFGESALTVTEAGLIIYANNAFEKLLGCSTSSIIGTEIHSLVSPKFREDFRKIFQSAFSGNSRGEIVLSYKKKKIPVYVSLSSLYPRFAGIGMILTDLSEKKQQEERLEEMNEELKIKNIELNKGNKELASFNYIASHDLQEPLRKIQTFIGKLFATDVKNISERGQDYLNRIISATSRMQNLINALLSYSRLDSREMTFANTDLNNIVSEVVNDFTEILVEKKVEVTVDPLPTLPVLRFQLIQLFSNLIDNAIKYSKADCPLKIAITSEFLENFRAKEGYPPQNYWKISFSDNGIGFDPDYNEKIFELFSRLHNNSEYPGTGIGLAICKKVMENHHGMIMASGVPGQGALFQIFIPENKN
jgi:PAS domain S-box-containing protein